MFSGHQRYSGILIPTISRLLIIHTRGVFADKPLLLNLEVLEAQFV